MNTYHRAINLPMGLFIPFSRKLEKPSSCVDQSIACHQVRKVVFLRWPMSPFVYLSRDKGLVTAVHSGFGGLYQSRVPARLGNSTSSTIRAGCPAGMGMSI
jgi:hypothetical protein